MKKIVTVDGMMCMHCVAHVKDALSKVEGVSDVVVSLDEKTATLNWKKLSSASGYVVYRSASKNGSYTKISTIKKNKTITYKDSKLKRKSTYYYKIVPYTTIGKTTVYGLDSKIVSIKIK